jgi:C-terminal processing protease CtpA/Prc
MALPADDTQAEREARRMENEARRVQEMGRIDMENRERAQAEALRSQDEAIRRMEATQSRMDAVSRQMNQQSADQARAYSYPYAPYSAPNAQVFVDRALQGDPVSAISFAPLSERLKSYFGAQSGVLVVSAGTDAPFGLQDGDVIISVDGRAPADPPHAARILRSYQPGERVKLRVQRDQRTIDLDITAPVRR